MHDFVLVFENRIRCKRAVKACRGAERNTHVNAVSVSAVKPRHDIDFALCNVYAKFEFLTAKTALVVSAQGESFYDGVAHKE